MSRGYSSLWWLGFSEWWLLLLRSMGSRCIGFSSCSSPWGREEWDTTERLLLHFSLSCIGEGNGNPLQCSCLENPRDGEAWWAAVYGVAQSWTRLKRLSSSSCGIWSLVAALRLSCSVTCGIFLDQELNLCPLPQSLGHQRSSKLFYLPKITKY